MRKQGKKLVVFLLLLTMLLSQAEVLSLTTKASTETTKTWDFADESQADDFTFLKTSVEGANEKNMYISGGCLVADVETNSSSIHKKALLKECEGGYIDTFRVSVLPTGDSGVIDASLWIGVQPSENGTVQSAGANNFPGIRFRYRDLVTTNSRQELSVTLYDGSNQYTILNLADASASETTTVDINDQALAGAIAMELKVNTDNTITWTLTDLTSKTFTKTIDLTKTTTDTDTTFTPSMLRGQVGVGAFYRGASFDNLSITYKELTSEGYDFSDVGDVYTQSNKQYINISGDEFYTVSSDNTYMVGAAGRLTAAHGGTDIRRKVIYNSNIDVIDNVSVDISAAKENSKQIRSSVYLYIGATTTNEQLNAITHYTTGQQGLVFTFIEDQSAGNGFEIQAQFIYRPDSSTNVTYGITSSTYTPDWYTSGKWNDEYTMQVEVLDRNNKDKFSVTVMDKENPDNYIVWSTSIAEMTSSATTTTSTEAWKNYMATTKPKSVGLCSWHYGACFDNFTINGKMFTLDGIADSQITVNNYGELPIGANVVDGKYVLGWTLNGNAVDTYNGYQGSYIANVVDPAMLNVKKQAADVTNDTRTLRFVASLNEFYNATEEKFENYKSAGFVFTTNATVGVDAYAFKIGKDYCANRQTYNLYSTLLAEGVSVTADTAYGGNGYAQYFFAFELSGAPTDATVYVRAYVELENGTVVYGQPETVKVAEVQ